MRFRREQGRGGRSRGRRPGRPAAEAVRGRTDHRGGDEQEPPGLTDLPPSRSPLAGGSRVDGPPGARTMEENSTWIVASALGIWAFDNGPTDLSKAKQRNSNSPQPKAKAKAKQQLRHNSSVREGSSD